MSMPLCSSRRTYNRISTNHDDATSSLVGESNVLDEPLSPSSSFPDRDDSLREDGIDAQINNSGGDPAGSQPNLAPSNVPPIYREINVVVMDSAQSKFDVKCDPGWKVSDFKEASASVTRVPPRSQRLIHMGQLLRDESTMVECGISENDKIIHLFPKPNVVINTASSANNADGRGSSQTGNDDDEGAAEGGAHVPQIILDADEASRRSQILILSSQEIFEAQHRVKIFSFLLMIICSMELLTLMTLFVGMQAEDPTGYGGGGSAGAAAPPPGNPTDSPPSSSPDAGMQMRTWQDSDYFDALISAFGFYVSLLGIRASTENTLCIAKRYFSCLCVAGVGFNCYYYYVNIRAEERAARERDRSIDPGELYTTALVGILLPLTVWLLCILRAYQFQRLIREAELEADERAQGHNQEGEGANMGGIGIGDGGAPRSLPYGSNDLELAAEQGISS